MGYHKKIRLNVDIYRRPDMPCSITICTKNKKPIFSNTEIAQGISKLLKEIAYSNNIPIYAYCIMPDHIHLLLSASEKKGIVEFIAEFKSLSTRLAWNYNMQGVIWQKSFYDHFLRKGEDIKEVAIYILNNPVRKGIVQEWNEYKFSGSFVYDL